MRGRCTTGSGVKRCFGMAVLWMLLSVALHAESLVAVYQHALSQDPVFKAATQQWGAQQQDVPIARASLLPQVVIQSNIARERNQSTLSESLATLLGQTRVTSYSTPYSYGAVVRQPLLNVQGMATLSEAKASVRAAKAQWQQAKQSLLLRVAQQYFSVLQAVENLRFVEAEEKALAQQLNQAHQRYKVGLSAITPYYEARAKHDAIVAQRIGLRYALANRLEQLRAITGHYYTKLQAVSRQFSPRVPPPVDIKAWVDKALQDNGDLQVAQQGLLAAKRHIDAVRARRYPTIHAEVGYLIQRGRDTSLLGVGELHNGYARLALSFPLMQGGQVSGETRKAYFTYRKKQEELIKVRRQTVSQTRQAYWDIVSTINEIHAGRRAEHSAQSALDANQAGYRVGTRTMVDVLLSQSQLYQVKNTLIQKIYAHFLQSLQLKFVAGHLTEADLQTISQHLTRSESIDFNLSRAR